MDPRTRALLMVILDMDPSVADEAEFNEWFSDEHVAERLDCPGFLAGHRFELAPETSSGPNPLPKYLTLYELESLDALETDVYQALREPGSALTERMRPAMRNVTRGAFSLMDRPGEEA
jgi:hypothetical protein